MKGRNVRWNIVRKEKQSHRGTNTQATNSEKKRIDKAPLALYLDNLFLFGRKNDYFFFISRRVRLLMVAHNDPVAFWSMLFQMCFSYLFYMSNSGFRLHYVPDEASRHARKAWRWSLNFMSTVLPKINPEIRPGSQVCPIAGNIKRSSVHIM